MKTKVKNQNIKSLIVGLAAALSLANVARAKDMALENPDFASGLAGWTQVGWGNDNPGIVYSTSPGGDRTVAAHPFKRYLNGGCCVSDTFHFLVASYMAGLGDRADRMLSAMLQRQWAGVHENGGGFQNGLGGGGEFYTWDGTPCGYEGHLTYSYTFLQAALLREPAFRERIYGNLYPKSK